MPSYNVRERIESRWEALSPSEQAIAEHIVRNPREAAHMTINELASSLDMANSTISKFTRKLGYEGFRDFRTDLLIEDFDPRVSIQADISEEDSPGQIASKVFDASIRALTSARDYLEPRVFERAAELIVTSEELQFYGVGESAVLASHVYHKFLNLPLRIMHNIDSHEQLSIASKATSNTCAIVFSYTGMSRETVGMATELKRRGAKIICITSNPETPIVGMADVSFITFSRETNLGSAMSSSRLVHLAICDALYSMCAIAFPDETELNREHISSALRFLKEN